ncbi:hypothetical protein LTS18_004880 [Coniosporium uncinatum]|uniref:Uncharacterized protein n=1 Tax=Coniosporium uncinatum TaxID=93489 RepID=A0ACC3DXW5_9PEZI|nr:hypothetical protein LTS18_004880 [Coniosporium uncinatum]
MSRWGKLAILVRVGATLMVIGNLLVWSFHFHDASWKYVVYLLPANLGQGIVYPGILFTFLAAFQRSDHAVSTSTVYLIRSLGWVWGVAITSAITQNVLKDGLPKVLDGIPDKWRVIEEIRHSVDVLKELPPEISMPARLVYYDAIERAFLFSTIIAAIGFVAALFTRGRGLDRE